MSGAGIPFDRHCVVEASAGTGKTYMIEHHVVALVESGVPLDSILVVTFTEKATAELRFRIRALLQSRAGELPAGDARTAVLAALHGFDGAPIHTIHAWCQRVLTEHAFANRRLFEQTQTDRGLAFGGAFKTALRTRLSLDPNLAPYLDRWLRGGRSVQALEALLLDCANASAPFEPVYDPAAIRAALAELPALTPADIRAQTSALTTAMTFVRVNPRVASSVVDKAVVLAELLAQYRDDDNLPALLDGLQRADEPSTGVLRYFLKYIDGKAFKDERATRLQAMCVGAARAALPFTSAVAQRLLPAVLEQMIEDKRRLGQFDFDDMLELVWRSLDDDGGDDLAERLRERYRYALIDEFQDTDELQWNIFRKVFVAGDGDSRLCVIGDPKQAIYSFRGADVYTYLRAREELLAGGGARVSLASNWRSAPALVDAYNELLRQDVGTPLFTGDILYDEPVTAMSESAGMPGAPVRVLHVVPPAGKKLNADGLLATLGPAIAEEIHGLMTSGVGAGDIFVLTRTTRETVDMARMLRDARVPCALYKQEGLFQTDEAGHILDLLRGIAHPRRQSERFKAWQTPFFDVALADLVHARDLPDTHPLIERLVEWKQLADRQAYERLFDRILSDSGLIRRELFLRQSERSLTNYLHIFELLLEDARSARLDLGELIRRLDATVRRKPGADGSDRDVQRLESERNAVQIMTMHKAKGLEAEVVFIVGGCGALRGDAVRTYHRVPDRARVTHVGPVWESSLADQIKDEQRHEEQRLLYVALTRAKSRMYLPHIDSKACTNVQGLYTYLRRQVQRVLDDPRFEVVEIPAAMGATGDDRAPTAALAAWQPPAALLAPPDDSARFDVLRDARRGPEVTSYTRLKQHENSEFKAAVDVAVEPPGDDELPGGAATGIFLHDVLEHLAFDTFRDEPSLDAWGERPDIDKLVRDTAARHGVDPRHIDHAKRLVFQSMTAPTRFIDGIWRCGANRREVEFVYPADDATFVKGFIDLMFEHDGAIYLLDWKSDVLSDYTEAALGAHCVAHYDLQVRLYTEALVRMLRIADEAEYTTRFGGMLFGFLRGPGFWHARPSWAEVGR